MPEIARPPLFRKVDAVQIRVSDLDAGLAFYRDLLGHELRWRSATAAGLGMPEADTEIVLQTEIGPETDLLVASVEQAVEVFAQAGGTVIQAPFDIPIGRCAVVEDPWGNRLVLLDLSKGLLVTDVAKNVLTNSDGSLRVEPRAIPGVDTAQPEG